MHLYVSDDIYPVRLCDLHSASLPLEKVKATTYCDYCRFEAYNPGYTVSEYMQIYTAARQLMLHVKYIGHEWETNLIWIAGMAVRFKREKEYIKVYRLRGETWIKSS